MVWGVLMDFRFVADSMLGRLAKWLRVVGYDTHYQPYYTSGTLGHMVQDGRCLLSRNRSATDRYPHSMFIRSDHVKDQLHEMLEMDSLAPDRSRWFSRCLVCNESLRIAEEEAARENVPEYVYYGNMKAIRFCPSCGRYFWPGTHRKRMIAQLEEWGFTGAF